MAIIRLPASGQFPDAFPGLSEAQIGTIGEDRIRSAFMVGAGGLGTVALPLLDGGFDLYFRRNRTLRIYPIQVKARHFLEPDGQFQLTIERLVLDPHGFIVLPYVPPPDFQLQQAFWAFPIQEFIKLARPHDRGYDFAGYLDARFSSAANDYLVAVDRIETQWLHRLPGWMAPVHSPADAIPAAADEVPRQADQALGRFGELWLSTELMRKGLNTVVVAEDRLRVDCVAFVLHDLRSFSLRGLVVHSATVNATGVVEYRIRTDTFFTDPRLDLVLIACSRDLDVKQTFLVPSSQVHELATGSADRGDGGYQLSFRLDRIPPRWRACAVAPEAIAEAILTKL